MGDVTPGPMPKPLVASPGGEKSFWPQKNKNAACQRQRLVEGRSLFDSNKNAPGDAHSTRGVGIRLPFEATRCIPDAVVGLQSTSVGLLSAPKSKKNTHNQPALSLYLPTRHAPLPVQQLLVHSGVILRYLSLFSCA